MEWLLNSFRVPKEVAVQDVQYEAQIKKFHNNQLDSGPASTLTRRIGKVISSTVYRIVAYEMFQVHGAKHLNSLTDLERAAV